MQSVFLRVHVLEARVRVSILLMKKVLLIQDSNENNSRSKFENGKWGDHKPQQKGM